MALQYVLVLVALLGVSCGEIVKFTSCPSNPNFDYSHCQVSQVRITPCDKTTACSVKKGKTTEISFDFTPDFKATNMQTMVYYSSAVSDMEFNDLGSTNACDYTGCPTVPGTQQTYNFSLSPGKKLPSGTYPILWKVWNTENEKENVCCFKLTIKLK